MPGVSDCAESAGCSRLAHPPVLPSAMLNDVGTPVAIISQLNTLPACPPVNASMAASRLATHDSGPGWLATPFLYDSFIHNSTPVYPGALCTLLSRSAIFPEPSSSIPRYLAENIRLPRWNRECPPRGRR